MNYEEWLAKETFKEDGLELEKRVFYTLTNSKPIQADRTAKALSLLVKHLRDSNVINDADIDRVLFEATR